MKSFIPNRTKDDCVVLPAGIDFRKPGQRDPYKPRPERNDSINSLLALGVQQQNRAASGMFGTIGFPSPFGGS